MCLKQDAFKGTQMRHIVLLGQIQANHLKSPKLSFYFGKWMRGVQLHSVVPSNSTTVELNHIWRKQ